MKYLEIFSYIAPIRSNNHSTGRITSPKILVLGGQSVFVVYFDGEACSLYVHTCIPFIYEHCCIRIICMSWSEGEKKKNLRRSGQKQRSYLQKNNVGILDKLLDLWNSILNSQELLHGVHWRRGHHLYLIDRPPLIKISSEQHEDCYKEKCCNKCITHPSPTWVKMPTKSRL